MATDQGGAAKVPPVIERFVRQLVVANKAVALFPPSSTVPRENAGEAVNALNDALEEYPEISLAITRQGLHFDDRPVYPGRLAYSGFAMEFYKRRLAVVRFHSGVRPQDLIAFLGVLKYTPEELEAAGGYEAQLWDQGVGAITVVETQAAVVDQAAEAEEGADEGLVDTLTTDVEIRSNVPRTQKSALEGAVDRFARAEDIRAITQTLHAFAPGEPEYEAAQRLLNALGGLAVRPLLEQLADEPDRAERRALIDLISKDASKYISELSSYVGDGRWYFVRNVVAILGSTRSPAILTALERTMRHSEPRVRRESIRALSMVQDRPATEMLVAALADEDAHNVQLAARYLGQRGVPEAVPALETVAKGDGRGNRENGPRVEAIEALGRMGATSAIPALESIARKRPIIGAARTKELRAAAESALAVIRARERG